MSIYTQVIKNTVGEYMIYRLNFTLWRVRMVVRLLVLYFLWQAIFAQQNELFGYQKAQILTYIVGSQIASTIVLATRTQEVGGEIQQGNLTNFLLRPINYFAYLSSRDLADKLLNITFAIVEVILLVILFRPDLFWQKNPAILLATFAALGLGIGLFFCISTLLGFLGFWTQESWAPRFLFIVVNEFLSGGLFPLDILPSGIYQVLSLLPFTYLLFFPLKVYLGQLSPVEVITGFTVGIIWLGILFVSLQKVWQAGLRLYTAEGR